MKWASTLSRAASTTSAFHEAATAIEDQLGPARADLVLLFASPHHTGDLGVAAQAAAERFPAAVVAGCGAGGVIGGAREAEDGPALSLTAASLPGVARAAFHVDMVGLPEPEASPDDWHAVVGADPEHDPKLLLLVDPFTMDAGALVAGLDRAYPGAPKFGGLASGGRRPGENRLVLGGELHRSGAVGIALSGAIEVETVVAQGCRPIGKPMLVTRCRGGLLAELDGKPPLEVIRELHASLPSRDKELMQRSLFLGIDMRADRVEYDPGELLVRNLLGADEETGSLAVGAELQQMQVVQFVLRDARSAAEELARLLDRQRAASAAAPPSGALLFSCLGRGAGLFGAPDHDTGLFEEKLGPAPLGGFFCNGEIGPVGGTTFLHGYTSAFALFRALPRRS